MRPSPTPRRRYPLAFAALVVVVVSCAESAVAAPAAPAPERPAATAQAPGPAIVLARPSPALPGLPAVSLDLAEVRVDSPTFRREQARYAQEADALASAQSRRLEIDHGVASLLTREVTAERGLAGARAQASAIQSHLDDIDEAIADLAVSLYTSGGATARVDAALATDQPSINESDRRDVLGSASLDVLLAERSTFIDRLRAAKEQLATQRTQLQDAARARQELEDRRPSAAATEVGAAPAVATQRAVYEHARILAPIEHLGFPLVALDAYYRSAAVMAREAPRCGLRWWAVAGISRVEGHHGSYGGTSLDHQGNPSKRIIGIPLDGTNQTQVVRDSDRGTLDGDATYDRAVGPMQFIPQTWSRFAADGNDDGTRTPFNLYDAALAAARYLCHTRGGLDADPGLRAAYFSYNHSEDYVNRVLGFARLYERAIELPRATD